MKTEHDFVKIVCCLASRCLLHVWVFSFSFCVASHTPLVGIWFQVSWTSFKTAMEVLQRFNLILVLDFVDDEMWALEEALGWTQARKQVKTPEAAVGTQHIDVFVAHRTQGRMVCCL